MTRPMNEDSQILKQGLIRESASGWTARAELRTLRVHTAVIFDKVDTPRTKQPATRFAHKGPHTSYERAGRLAPRLPPETVPQPGPSTNTRSYHHCRYPCHNTHGSAADSDTACPEAITIPADATPVMPAIIRLMPHGGRSAGTGLETCGHDQVQACRFGC